MTGFVDEGDRVVARLLGALHKRATITSQKQLPVNNNYIGYSAAVCRHDESTAVCVKM